jgi:glycosyltransferase involved in cell wall biosynthesis
MPLTGIGHYTQQVGRGLLDSENVEDFKLFAHGKFFDHSILAQTPQGQSNNKDEIHTPSLFSQARTRLALSPIVVKTYQTVFPYIEKWTLRHTSDSLFHAPNFMLPNFDGRKVATIHDLSTLRFPQHHPKARVDFVNHAINHALEHADHIITDSDFIKSELIDLLGADSSKLTTVPLGADPAFKPRSKEVCETPLRKYGLNYEGYFLFVSTIEPRKNLHNLLQSFVHYRDKNPHGLPLVIVGGDGWHNSSLLNTIDDLQHKGWVKRLGYVPQRDMPVLFSGGKALLFPSTYEGFGLPVLEAMQSGLPVLTSKMTSMSEIIEDCGLLVDKDDVEGMTESIISLVENKDLTTRLSQKGIIRARSFSWEKCVRDTLAVYRNVIY